MALYTLEEKINATSSSAPGVERLGIPAYTWWNEALHGTYGTRYFLEHQLTCVGITDQGTNYTEDGDYSFSTSFPQPILMGAAFDDDLIKAVATVIATEARAFNNVNRCVPTGGASWGFC